MIDRRASFERWFCGVFSTLIIFVIFVQGAIYSVKTTTYTEYQDLSDSSENYVVIANPRDEISQVFTTPYDIISKVAIKVGTFDRINNSRWKIEIVRINDGKLIAFKSFAMKKAQDKNYFTVPLSSNILLKKDTEYCLRIYSQDVNDDSATAFYVSSESASSKGTLCLRFYGCDLDFFWVGLYIFWWIIGIVIFVMVLRVHVKGSNPLQDKWIQPLLLFVFIFAMLYVFSKGIGFIDENDNIRGGMIIANGGVLYRDYITQHTPVMYYLCGIFALLGAGSVQQFRIYYYILFALIFVLLYIRYSSFFGKWRLNLIPACIIISITTFFRQGYEILSDSLQGLCMVALCMEFLRYYADRRITWDRCLIVSACIWGSFGAAFISVYALAVIVLAVVIIEINDWLHGKYSSQITTGMLRYGKLGIAIAAPFICVAVYFKHNDALRLAYDMAYRFNREVYPLYIRGFGSSIAQPFFRGIENFFTLARSSLSALFVNINVVNSLKFVVVALAVLAIINLMAKKKCFLAAVLFLFMTGNLTRGAGFHGIAFWYLAITIDILFAQGISLNPVKETQILKNLKIGLSAVCVLLGLYLTTTYLRNTKKYLFQRQAEISAIEQYVVSNTADGEFIFIDTYTKDSIYLLYKNRYPVNRLTYFLPWYLAWYEQFNIEDLKTRKPNLMIYNPHLVTWKIYKDYSNAFRQVAEENYVRLSDNPDDGWKCYVWLRKD